MDNVPDRSGPALYNIAQPHDEYCLTPRQIAHGAIGHPLSRAYATRAFAGPPSGMRNVTSR
jgi:hypothetical protein